MELKTIIYYLLLNFSFEVHEKTQIPLRMEKSPNRLTPEKGIWLELRPRSGRTKNQYKLVDLSYLLSKI